MSQWVGKYSLLRGQCCTYFAVVIFSLTVVKSIEADLAHRDVCVSRYDVLKHSLSIRKTRRHNRRTSKVSYRTCRCCEEQRVALASLSASTQWLIALFGRDHIPTVAHGRSQLTPVLQMSFDTESV